MTLFRCFVAGAAALGVFSGVAFAQATNPHAGHGAHAGSAASAAAPAASAAAVSPSEGEVRRVDLDQGRVTIRHGEITHLSMPAMTMVFHADKAELNGLNVGDKIRFVAALEGGRYVARRIQRE